MFNAIVLRAAFFLFEDWMMPSVLDVMRDDLFIRRPDAATEFDDRTRMRRLNPTTDLFMQRLVYAATCLCNDLFMRRPDAATKFDDRTRMRRLNPTTSLCNDLFMQRLVYAMTCFCDDRTRQPNSTTEREGDD